MSNQPPELKFTAHEEYRAQSGNILMLLELAMPEQVKRLKHFIIKTYGMPSHSAVVKQMIEAIEGKQQITMSAVGIRERIFIHNVLNKIIEGGPDNHKALKEL